MHMEKRVIILNRVNSPHIAQAIFILKDKSRDEFIALEEAERILCEYALGSSCRKKHGGILLAWCCVLAAGILFFFAMH